MTDNNSRERYLMFLLPDIQAPARHNTEADMTAYSAPEKFRINRTASEPAPAPRRSEPYTDVDLPLYSKKTEAIINPEKKKGMLSIKQYNER